jgi:hypothetical protein
LYWLVFALCSVDAAREPGFVSDPAHAPYPWLGLLTTWLILALETGLLNLILRPKSFARSWMRLSAAIALYVALSAFSTRTILTDMPGLYYVPGLFHLTTLVALIILAFVVATQDNWSRNN